jgi:acyl-CoA reductase-like NAD-dependent aldehyde dehydrogenase
MQGPLSEKRTLTVQIQKYKMLIGGEWKDSSNGAVSSVLDPSNQEVVAEVPRASKQDAKAAIESARGALDSAGWVDIDPSKRGRLLIKLTSLIRENSDQLARLETMSEGKTLRESKGDVAWAARAFEYWAGLADKVEGETIPVPPRRLNYTLREPLGVTVHIVPWNYPIALAARSMAPAIAAGNTVVMKPSEITPLTAILLGDLALKAGIPKGVVNIVTGSGADAGAALVSDPGVDGIVFTGSAETGKQVMESAARNVTRVLLELGGKNPHIVFPDADLAKASKSVKEGIFTNAGQMCWAGSRAFVHESVYDGFVKDLVAKTRAIRLGPGTDESSEMGPLASKSRQEIVLGFVKDGIEEGASLLCGGKKPNDPKLEKGNFVEPTIFENVTGEMKIGCDEIFGPVLSVTKFKTLDEVVGMANETDYGLYGGVWTSNIKVAHELAARLQVGALAINEYLVTFPQTPFSGYKDSGIGHENGTRSLEFYTRTKNVSVNLS